MTKSESQDLKTVAWSPLMAGTSESSAWMGRPWWFKLIWVTLIMKKNQNGYVDMSLLALARAAEVTVEQAREALTWYAAPDPDSTSQKNEGRHIRAVNGGGWLVLNHAFYRDLIGSAERKNFKNQWARDKRARLNAKGEPEDPGRNQSGSGPQSSDYAGGTVYEGAPAF